MEIWKVVGTEGMAKLTLFFHNRIILHYYLDGEVACIGRDDNCEIKIDSLAVAKRHAWITAQGNDYEISPVEEDAVILVNHQPVKTHLLQHGDLIQVGKHTLTFAESVVTPNFVTPKPDTETGGTDDAPATRLAKSDADPAPDQLVNKGCIQVISGEHMGKIISLFPPLVRVGLTGKECAMVSRRREGYYLSHLEGEKRPLVDGKAIGDQSILLQDGDLLEIDVIEMRFYEDTVQATQYQPGKRRVSGAV